jgi:hypothetical protein
MTTHPTQSPGAQANYCPRNPGIETNLRCGKCGQFICPRCLVQTPVGARCPDCARMRKNPAFDPSSQDMLLAAGAGLGVAVAAGVLLGAVVATLARVPYGYMFGVLAGQAAAGWAIGETVYRVSRHKRSRGLSYVAAISAFVAYVAAKAVSHALGVNGIVDLWELLGLGASVYIAMGRLRP